MLPDMPLVSAAAPVAPWADPALIHHYPPSRSLVRKPCCDFVNEICATTSPGVWQGGVGAARVLSTLHTSKDTQIQGLTHILKRPSSAGCLKSGTQLVARSDLRWKIYGAPCDELLK